MQRTAETRSDVLVALKDNQEQIKALGVRSLGLFGSFARDECRADSDVDLLVEFEPGRKTFDNFMRLSFLIEDILRRHVELVTAESLSPYMRPQTLREVQLESEGS